jgi:site-specific DNA recombinase
VSSKHVRCAIYTRKSSEEGLEQSFNSLDAQREACRAFILSQKHEGWTALNDRYDDGGFSGGTMDRPALNQLLNNIKDAKIDTVVVYKVDRLTRSLSDFAKIVEILDAHKVSFVSVTQQFNTTSSMGRLTLNVLLSFAQFEREVTSERIRDKIAASKKKGMWMGGMVPLGYDCVERRLVVNQVEVDTVRRIFREYLRLGCVTKLKDFMHRRKTYSKVRTSNTGRKYGGATYSRGALHHLLRNRIYLGEIVHRNQHFPGKHNAIISQKLWDQVQARLHANDQARRTGKSSSTPSSLCGRLFDANGVRFTPTHSVKNGKRYSYYTSQSVIQRSGSKPVIARFPAQELEQLVNSRLHLLLQTPDEITARMKESPSRDAIRERAVDLAKEWPRLEISRQQELIRRFVRRITVGQTKLWMEVDRTNLLTYLLGRDSEAPASLRTRELDNLRLSSDFKVLRRGSELRVVSPDGGSSSGSTPVPALVKAVVRARGWYDCIVAGEIRTIGKLAQKSGLTRRYVRRILQCATLSPQVTEALLTGEHRPDLVLKEILLRVPLSWREQESTILREP